MPCLFISAWHMAMMLIDFIKPTPKPCLTLPSLHSSHPLQNPPLLGIAAHCRPSKALWSPVQISPFRNPSRRREAVIVNNRWRREYTDSTADCIACAVVRETCLCIQARGSVCLQVNGRKDGRSDSAKCCCYSRTAVAGSSHRILDGQ